MIDDIEEIQLTPDRTGSARVIRRGKKRAADALAAANKRPLWRRQLQRRPHKAAKPVTLKRDRDFD